LRTIVREAAERARTPEEFFDALQAAGSGCDHASANATLDR
jgi:hypothetical protein